MKKIRQLDYIASYYPFLKSYNSGRLQRKWHCNLRSLSSSTASHSYYDILGAKKTDNVKEIKKKYRMLAKKFHPDTGASDSKKFQEINEAWEVLKDEKSRKVYDDLGHESFLRFKESGQDPVQDTPFGSNMDLNDLFGDIFGAGRGFGEASQRKAPFRQARKGEDLRLTLELSFEQAIRGTSKSLSYSRFDKCGDCKGSGIRNNDMPDKGVCSDCKGSGVISKQMGFMIAQETCRTCDGSGKIARNQCASCSGEGRVRTKAEVTDFSIPPGVDTGSVFQKINGGNVGFYGGKYGDLLIHLVVSKDKSGLYERRGLDIYSFITISLVKSLVGGRADVVTPLEENLNVKIRPGTLHGTMLRMQNKGVKYGSMVGDFYLKVLIQPIESLSPRQKLLLEEFEEEEKRKHKDNISEVTKS